MIDDRDSKYNQELGRKLCAAFLSQQTGISLSAAERKLRKCSEPVGELWLWLAKLATRCAPGFEDHPFSDGEPKEAQ